MPLFARKNDWSQDANNFDALRLCLALLVIISHSYPLFLGWKDPWEAQGATHNIGQVCVMAFFVISGLLVTRSAVFARSGLSYGVSRAMRLLPGAFVCALWMTFVLGLAFTTLDGLDYLKEGSVYSFLVRNTFLFAVQYDLPGVFKDNLYPGAVNGSLWSLKIEIRLYVLFFIIVFGMRRLNLMRYFKHVCLFMAVFIFFISSVPIFSKNFSFFASNNVVYGYYFLAGAAILGFEDRLPRHLGLAMLLFVLSLLTVGTAFLDPLMRLTLPYLVYCFAFSDARVLRSVRGLPDISYGIYIYGFPVQQALSALYVPKVGAFSLTLAALGMTIGFAVLSWRFVERPALIRKGAVEAGLARFFGRLGAIGRG